MNNIKKIPVGLLGATGVVGQNYIKLLQNHTWFEITCLAASPRSAGKTYEKAVTEKWQMDIPVPENLSDMIVQDASKIDKVKSKCSFVFSAIELKSKDAIRELETKYAQNNIPVISNNSAHRWTPDIPMIIPEINHHHSDIIPSQQKNNNFKKGFIAVKPNCSLQSYLTPFFALQDAGYPIDKIILTTMQAVSGAGYPGVSSMDMIDNLVPFIGGEEEKTEQEPLKILGKIKDNKIMNSEEVKISASCNRVPVRDGHTACVSFSFKDNKISKKEILKIWKEFRSYPQEEKLPFAPKQPIIYLENEDRPQPVKDKNNDKGMAVTIGRLRECNILDYKFTSLSHNTIRGAAGGGILNAELLVKKGYL